MELIEFWRTIINTFAHCTLFKITHNDIKPSNILLQKIPDGGGDLNSTFKPKISDFGTSVEVAAGGGAKGVEAMHFVARNALTEAFASPNVLQGEAKMNPYLEDVFSLGLSFLQMARLFKESELIKYQLNVEVGKGNQA